MKPVSSVLFVLALCMAETSPAASNVLVFVADDMGWRDAGAYGHPNIETPHIDALARDGWTAENAFVTTPQCSPSRISLLTGLFAHSVGSEDLHMPLPAGQYILPHYLGAAGYFTGSVMKRHFGPEAAAQFHWYGETLDGFGEFLDAAGKAPFFLWVGFSDPHRAYGDAPVRHRPSDVQLPPTVVDMPATRADYAQYYDEIARLDGVIGAYVTELARRGLRDSTYLVFLSDNGAPMPREKGTLYDAGIKSPFIVSGPSVPRGVRYAGLISLIDLAPTILDWAGSAAAANMYGASLRPLMEDPSLPGREYVFAERNWHNIDEHMRSVRTQGYKLIWNNYIEYPHGTAADITASPTWQALREGRDRATLTPEQSLLFQAPRPRVELYDVRNDPYELDNLAAQPGYRLLVQRLMAELEAWMDATGDVHPDRRRRDDNTDRYTGVKFTLTIPPLRDDHWPLGSPGTPPSGARNE